MHADIILVDDVAEAFAALVNAEQPSSIALSGGSTAEECYRALARTQPDWSNVDVYYGDERFVPLDSPDSNEGMTRRLLLDGLSVRAVHSMCGTGTDIDAAAAAYDMLIAAAPPIDLVHLGLGPDGHTASLFPGSPALDVVDRFVVATGDDRHPQPRLTFTYPAIARAKLVVFTVEGAAKAAAFAAVRDHDHGPAARVTAPRVVWLVDPPALGVSAD
jgi:6-phosphogluconolactonase